MSRVTIGELTEDMVPFTEESDQVISIEVIPRSIVEKIIYFCESNANLESSLNTRHYDNGWHDALMRVKERAEYLLTEFERD